MNYHESVREYVFNHLHSTLTDGSVGEKVNLFRHFREFFSSKGHAPNFVDELLERQGQSLISCVEEYISSWEAMLLPSPIELAAGQTVITYKNSKFEDVTGRVPLPSNYGEVHEYIKTHNEKEFLFVCAVELRVMGASSIFITDTSGDQGIDLIAHFKDPLFGGLSVFVQAKTSSSEIGREVLLTEYGKYRVGRMSAKYREYLRSLGVDRSGCGHGPVYVVMANTEFRENAKSVARELGILLRSRRQLAFSLSLRTGASKLRSMRESLGTLDFSLDRDLAASIRL